MWRRAFFHVIGNEPFSEMHQTSRLFLKHGMTDLVFVKKKMTESDSNNQQTNLGTTSLKKKLNKIVVLLSNAND